MTGEITNRTVVLIGPMAVGKTTIGRELAALTGRDFADSDQVFEAKYGPISEVFSARGERWFREYEARTIADLLGSEKSFILSVGGGAVLDSGTQQLLSATTVVFLEADLDTVSARILQSSHRPLLSTTVGDPLQRWSQLLAERAGVYRRVADFTLDVRHGTPADLAQELAELIWPKSPVNTTNQAVEELP